MADPLRLGTFRLAGHLGKTVAEIEEMPFMEFMEWWAFFKIEADAAKRR